MSGAGTLGDLVCPDIPVLTPQMPIRRAVATLVQERAAAAPVLDDAGVLRGMLSQKDCFRPALNASYYQEWKGTVADYMTQQVVTLPADTDLTAAAEAFLEYPFRAFPVLDGEQYVGLLRRTDVLAALIELG
ncbi:CBS domain-containing protein [Escherichia coli]|nr:CBS domain-containing protein [Escherichia coli]